MNSKRGTVRRGGSGILLALTANSAWNIVNFRFPLLRAFLKEDFSLVVFAPPDSTVSKLQELGCRFEVLPMSAHGLNPLADFLLFCRYLRLLHRYRPRALLSFTVRPNIFGGLAARFLRIEHIANVSGLGTAFIQGGLLGWLVGKLYFLGLRNTKTLFFQNPDDREFFLTRKFARRDQTSLLPGSGVDLEYFYPLAVKLAKAQFDRQFQFLFIGRLLGIKGLIELVEAVHMFPENQVKLVVLGSHDKTNPSAIDARLLAQWQNDPQLELLGARDDVRPFIASADCVVLPSYREGTPRALLEAAAMGKPLIASDVPGCREVVRGGSNGYLCRVKDSKDLARVMQRFMSLTLTEQQAMGRASRQLVEESFNEDLVVQRYFSALGFYSQNFLQD